MAAAIPARPAFRRGREKDLTLALARELRDELVEAGRVRVAMTRDDDRYLTLDDRAAVARRLECRDVRLAPHGQRPQSAGARRQRLFAVRRRLGRGSRALAARENRRCGQRAGRRLRRGDARRSRDSRADERFGRPCLAASRRSAGRVELRPNPHRFAAFHVLRRADAPRSCSRRAISAMPTTRCCCEPEQRAKIARAGSGDRSRYRRALAALSQLPPRRTG